MVSVRTFNSGSGFDHGRQGLRGGLGAQGTQTSDDIKTESGRNSEKPGPLFTSKTPDQSPVPDKTLY